MTHFSLDDERAFQPQTFPLAPDLVTYIAFLTQRAKGGFTFRTGAGRILPDLMLHWPLFDDWEDDALLLCQQITDASYPLASALLAQAVEISVRISPTSIEAPSHIEAMESFILFDIENKIEKRCFLSPQHPLPSNQALSAEKGLAVLCRPLNYNYHTVQDDRERNIQPEAGIYEIPERLIVEMMEQREFVPREMAILVELKKQFATLQQKMLFELQGLTTTTQSLTTTSVPDPSQMILRDHNLFVSRALSLTSIQTGIPRAIREIERRLFSYIMDKSISGEMRAELRRLAVLIRGYFPHLYLNEAARYETDTNPLQDAPSQQSNPTSGLTTDRRTGLTMMPKATPQAAVGRLEKAASSATVTPTVNARNIRARAPTHHLHIDPLAPID